MRRDASGDEAESKASGLVIIGMQRLPVCDVGADEPQSREAPWFVRLWDGAVFVSGPNQRS